MHRHTHTHTTTNYESENSNELIDKSDLHEYKMLNERQSQQMGWKMEHWENLLSVVRIKKERKKKSKWKKHKSQTSRINCDGVWCDHSNTKYLFLFYVFSFSCARNTLLDWDDVDAKKYKQIFSYKNTYRYINLIIWQCDV